MSADQHRHSGNDQDNDRRGGLRALAVILRRIVRPEAAERTSTGLIAMSLVLLAGIAVVTVRALSKESLFPAADARVDIRTVYLASAFDVCGRDALGSPPFQVVRYEDCIAQQLNQADLRHDPRWAAIPVPTLDELYALSRGITGAAKPSFGGTVRKIDAALHQKIYEQREPAVVAIEIPAELYSQDIHSTDYKVLVFSQMANGVVCVEGACKARATEFEYGGRRFPLLKRSEIAALRAEEHRKVFLFAHSPKKPSVLNLQDGVFITNEKDTERTNKLYPMNLASESFVYALVFIGALFFGLWQASTWLRYPDYAAYVYLAVSMAAVAMAEQPSLMPRSPEYLMLLNDLRIILWCNALVASFGLALHVSRIRFFSIRHTVGIVVLGSAAGLAWLILAPAAISLSARGDFARGVLGILLFSGPPLICGYAALRLRRRMHQPTARLSDREAMRQRITQLQLMALGTAGLGWQHALNGLYVFNGMRVIESFTPLSILAVLLIQYALFRPTMTKMRHALYKDHPKTEAGRLRLLLEPRAFSRWAARPRPAVLVLLDLAGASSLTTQLQGDLHQVMQALRAAAMLDLEALGARLIDAKPLGDEIVLIVEPRETLATELAALTDLIRARLPDYIAIVQAAYRAVGQDEHFAVVPPASIYVHAKVCAVEQLTLRADSRRPSLTLTPALAARYGDLASQSESADMLDFVSEEMNHYMKLVGKAERGAVTVCASAGLLVDAGIVAADGHKADTRQLADLAVRYLMDHKGMPAEAAGQSELVSILRRQQLRAVVIAAIEESRVAAAS